jgi:hypothetical protein
MKRIIAAATLAVAALGGSSFAATPGGFDSGVYSPSRDAPALQPAHGQVHRYTCTAQSKTAHGVGFAYNSDAAKGLHDAKDAALHDCAIHTPHKDECVIQKCF